MENIKISKMEEKDLNSVIEIQKELFTSDLHEDISTLRKRFELFPEGCWVAKMKDKIIGYLVFHPWMKSCPPMLGTCIEDLPEAPDCLYAHEIGVLTRIARRNLASEFFKKFIEFGIQQGYTVMSAVSVMGTLNYWKRYGFIETPLSPEKNQALIQHYGTGAQYITLTL
ncbi:MAG: GNAT family N-acetyltransferase [bacterium]|nr:GNAT family N-acetyltransferase [bacterium]